MPITPREINIASAAAVEMYVGGKPAQTVIREFVNSNLLRRNQYTPAGLQKLVKRVRDLGYLKMDVHACAPEDRTASSAMLHACENRKLAVTRVRASLLAETSGILNDDMGRLAAEIAMDLITEAVNSTQPGGHVTIATGGGQAVSAMISNLERYHRCQLVALLTSRKCELHVYPLVLVSLGSLMRGISPCGAVCRFVDMMPSDLAEGRVAQYPKLFRRLVEALGHKQFIWGHGAEELIRSASEAQIVFAGVANLSDTPGGSVFNAYVEDLQIRKQLRNAHCDCEVLYQPLCFGAQQPELFPCTDNLYEANFEGVKDQDLKLLQFNMCFLPLGKLRSMIKQGTKVVGIAGGATKMEGIASAIRTDIFTHFVTNSETAGYVAANL